MKHHLVIAAVALIAATAPGLAQPSTPAHIPNTPAMGLNYVCDIGRPEDMLLIPGTKYIITGGSAATGWGLIDSDTKAFRQLDLSHPKPDLKTYPDCPAMPAAKRLSAHGVAIRPPR